MQKLFDKKIVVIWDTEYTSWKGCNENGWDKNKNQYKELVQIGAILIDARRYEIKKEFSSFIKPQINSKLSNFFIKLTGIKQKDVDSADNPEKVIGSFLKFVKNYDCYSYGNDYTIIMENIKLNKLKIKANKNKYHDVRKIFDKQGIPTEKFNSSSITVAFGVKNKEKMHNALSDARSILTALKILSTNNTKL